MDFWTGINYSGEQWLRKMCSTLDRMPVFLRQGSKVPVYPTPVKCVDEMDTNRIITVNVDDTYKGIQHYLEFEV